MIVLCEINIKYIRVGVLGAGVPVYNCIRIKILPTHETGISIINKLYISFVMYFLYTPEYASDGDDCKGFLVPRTSKKF